MKILTFNTWLLEAPFLNLNLARDINKRLEHLPQFISDLDPDLIFLQEVWKPKYQNYLIKNLCCQDYELLNVENYPSRAMGHGLMVFSKFPFVSNGHGKPFRARTRFDEQFVSKGIVRGKIGHPHLGEIDVFNTHLGAISFNPDKGINHKQLRQQNFQRQDVIDFIKEVNGGERPYILAGDFNTHDHAFHPVKNIHDLSQLDQGYQFVLNELEIVDTYRHCHPSKQMDCYDGFTWASHNHYTQSTTNKAFFKDERVDYIFISKDMQFEEMNSLVVFDEEVDVGAKTIYLSDHFGLFSELKF